MTGTYSHLNGIIANRWYDREKKKVVGCVDDEAVQIVGTNRLGQSPRNLQTHTLGDMLRLHSNFRSKVFAIANKDRSAVLMAGKLGTAFWFQDSLIVSSTYYMQKLPSYVSELNSSSAFQQYFGKQWVEINPTVAARVCDQDGYNAQEVLLFYNGHKDKYHWKYL